MRAWGAKEFGNPVDVLQMEDRTIPDPEGQLIELKVDYAGVGLPDVLMLQGEYPAVQKPPIAPGQEVVGTVTRAGPDSPHNVGDRVMSSTMFPMGYGGFAEYCLGGGAMVLPIPKNMPDEQAAGFTIPFHTGYTGLVIRAQLQAGETLLVLGGAGSSGSAAIMLGKALGATVIATASSEEKAQFCRDLGADHVINYREQSIRHTVKEITGAEGAHVVYDPVGGSAYDEATKCIAKYGRIVLIGYGSGTWPKIEPLHVILRSYSLVGAFPGSCTPEETWANHAQMVEWAEAGKIWVPVDKVFSFEETPLAIDRVAKGEMVGKVVVKVS
jgi:NADPH2:quinone reductase